LIQKIPAIRAIDSLSLDKRQQPTFGVHKPNNKSHYSTKIAAPLRLSAKYFIANNQ
jgi:hypothetical protein